MIKDELLGDSVLKSMAVIFFSCFVGANCWAVTTSKLIKRHRVLLTEIFTCIDKAQATDQCRGLITKMTSNVQEIHQSLPPLPEGQGVGGSYRTEAKISYPPHCEQEAEALRAYPIHQCLGAWDFAANQKFKTKLPAEDCLALANSYSKFRKFLNECIQKK